MKLKDKIKLMIRGYKLLHALLPELILNTVFQSIFTQITPYITLMMSAKIINAIVMDQSLEYVLAMVLITVIGSFVINLVGSYFSKKGAYIERKFWIVCDLKQKDKIQYMDYELIEDTKIKESYTMIKTLQQTQGRGIFRLYWGIGVCMNALFNIIFSLGLVCSAFTGKGSVELGVWNLLYSHFIILGMVILFIINMIYIFQSKNKTELYAISQMKAIIPYSRLYFYFQEFMRKYVGAKDIKLYCYSCVIVDTARNTLSKLKERVGNVVDYQTQINTKVHILNALMQCVFYLYITLKALFGSFGVGNIVQYAGALMKLMAGVNGLAFLLGDWDGNCVALEQYFAFLDIPNKKHQGTLPVEKRYMCNDGDNVYEIEFRNVSFQYPNTSVYALKNLNFKLEIGKKLAVVGKNGSGKTTMIKLLTRLYDPTEGEILLNGINIKKYDYKEYMSIFGVVFQDFHLFAFTLGQNVACAVDYDQEKVRDCLTRVGFGDRLLGMPNGLDTCIYKMFDENGIEISGGEEQKIALARALYKEAPFVILDEPTAALDPLAEYEIYSKFDEIVGNKTAVYISHRLSSCKFCDQIVVFDAGELVAKGTHEELLADEQSQYFELWQAQAQYYKE